MSFRLKRVESLILREVSAMILAREIKDPRIGFVTITRVDVSPDLKNAKIYLTVLGEGKATKKTLAGLNHARGYIQMQLSHKIRMKYFPDIEFLVDEGIEHTYNINEIIEQIHREKPYVE